MSSWNSSYVLGFDSESGWGERYFFTYYNQFANERSIISTTIEVTIFVIIFCISLVTNIAIASCVFWFPDMKTVTNSFVLNLAAADLLFAFSIPAVAYSRVVATWKLGNVACKLIPYTQFVSGIVLLWTITLISMDRYRCIVIPPYRSKLTRTEASVYSAITWLLTSVLFIPVLLWFHVQETYDGKLFCTMVFPKSDAINYSLFFIIPLILIACLLPMIILVYNYKKIFHKILSSKNTWASSCVVASSSNQQTRRQSEVSLSDIFAPWPRKFSGGQFSGTGSERHGSLSQHEEMRLNKHIKVVRVLFLNVVMVLIMWLPITVVMFLMFVDGRRPTEDKNYFLRSHHFIISLIIALLNTVINPLLYGVLSDNFRTCLLKMLCKKADTEQINIIRENNTITPSSCRNHGSYRAARKQSFINSVSEIPNENV